MLIVIICLSIITMHPVLSSSSASMDMNPDEILGQALLNSMTQYNGSTVLNLVLDLISALIQNLTDDQIKSCVNAWKTPPTKTTETLESSSPTDTTKSKSSLIPGTISYIIGNRLKLLSGLAYQAVYINEYDALIENKIRSQANLKVFLCALLGIEDDTANNKILFTFLYKKLFKLVTAKLESVSTAIIDTAEDLPIQLLGALKLFGERPS